MILLSGASLVLPDRILSPGTLVIDGDRIVEIRPDAPSAGSAHSQFAFHDHWIVPGFIDVHLHGVGGVDALDGGEAVAAIAAQLPRYGVTAFSPTTVACAPAELRDVLDQVRRARQNPAAHAARVLPAHLESNFISAEYAGAQPVACIRIPAEPGHTIAAPGTGTGAEGEFSAGDILAEIERAAREVGIVTLAPELPGAAELIRTLTARGHRVSLGHSGASYDQGLTGIAAGARQATHLFNRMPPVHHRDPGLAGAVLDAEEVAAEIICDGFHVHPAMIRTALAAKTPSRVMAISDATSVAGLPAGSRGKLGGREIIAGPASAQLADGTLAGSTITMDCVFQVLVRAGISVRDAARLCSTTAAREFGLVGHGVLAADAMADLVVLDADFGVVQTYIAGRLVYSRTTATAPQA